MADEKKDGTWVTINGARVLLGSPAHKTLLRTIQQRRQAMKDTARGIAAEAASYVEAACLILHEAGCAEVTPPGFEPVVKALKAKKGVENPWAVAWAMKNRGASPEGKKKEAVTYAAELLEQAARLVEAVEDAAASTAVPPVSPKRRASVLARIGILRAKGTTPANLQPAPDPFPSKEAARGFLDELNTLLEAVEDAEAGTSQGAKKGWASRRGGQRFEPKPGGGVRKSKVKTWTPEMVAQQRRGRAAKPEGRGPKSEFWTSPAANIKGTPEFDEKTRRMIANMRRSLRPASEAAQPVRATLVIREAAGMSSLPQLGRAGVRVPGRPGSGLVRKDNGSVERVPVQKGSFHDDLRRKTSLRRMMHPAKPKVGAA